MCGGGGDWGVEMREERSCKSEERVGNYPQSYKNGWKINGCMVLVSTQIPQFWDTGAKCTGDDRTICSQMYGCVGGQMCSEQVAYVKLYVKWGICYTVTIWENRSLSIIFGPKLNLSKIDRPCLAFGQYRPFFI